MLVTTLSYMFRMGYKYSDLRFIAVAVCKVIFIRENGVLNPMPGEKVCGPLIDNYGLHVNITRQFFLKYQTLNSLSDYDIIKPNNNSLVKKANS